MRLLISACLLGLACLPAYASSEEAWQQFADDVRAACVAAAEPLMDEPQALVDPHGSESYGLALLHGKAKGGDTDVSAICVYDKATKKVEMGGELPTEELTP